MTADDRKQKIVELLAKEGSVKVTALSTLLKTSEVTIRNDLADLENKGLLSRVHGGAISSYKPYYSMNLNQRMTANAEAKSIIAEKVAGMVENNDTIMLNSGTTTLLVFRSLPRILT
ncbi:MAG: DeoR/GlpR transcriptional regulator [Ruminococcaceae bacterium]|nr:DeoR/GlpR transcriptional regulator [Oscillospiraceae bacterium]